MSAAAVVVTRVKYFICENNADRYDVPKNINAFRVARQLPEITLYFIKKRFEPLGRFRFFFKTDEGADEGEYVWEEVVDDNIVPLPTFKGELIIKALRIEEKLIKQQPVAAATSSGEAGVSPPPTTPHKRVYSEKDLEMFRKLEATTHFNQKEIRMMFNKFRKEAPNLEINRDGFALVTEGMGIKEKFLQDAIFNKFDINRSGAIDFEEFVRGMSVMTRGSASEKLEAAFKMFDLDNSGQVSKVEFMAIMDSFKHLQGGEVRIGGQTYTDITSICNELFEAIDVDHSGELSLEEYKTGALKHSEILRAFGVI